MCGIFGTFGIGDRREVEKGVAALSHRGPDGSGIAASGGAVHGHARLALLDLSDASAQPFQRGGGLLTFVGEIWNHAEVRSELRRLGERFSTTGDTEVVAAALGRWGVERGLAKLDGMFSICWSDGRGGHWLASDRFGKVPLMVERKGREFLWSSEVKAMPRPARSAAMPPASLLDLTTGRLTRWWLMPRLAEPLDDPAEALELLRRGVARRLAADAPVCVLCSGGLDSSLILMLAAELVGPGKLTAWTAFLDPDAEDLRSARRLCRLLGVGLEEVRCPAPTPELLSGAFRSIECRMKAQVEIALPCVALAMEVGKAGFKACLSGEAADELFGGYGNMIVKSAGLDDEGWRWLRVEQVAKMARGNFPRCNKAFMAGGVECRLPFMERELVERVLACGKRACPPGKGLLKDAAKLAGVPAWIVDRPKATFQGGSGVAAAAALAVANPTRFYNQESRRIFGRLL